MSALEAIVLGFVQGLTEFLPISSSGHLRIVNMLLRADGKAVCVCEFEPFLGLSQATVSHHLKVLTEAGLVEREGRGNRSYFSLVPGALDSVRDVFAPATACC